MAGREYVVSAVLLLQGKLFHDRMTPAVLQTIRSELVALEEDYIRRHPGTEIQRLA